MSNIFNDSIDRYFQVPFKTFDAIPKLSKGSLVLLFHLYGLAHERSSHVLTLSTDEQKKRTQLPRNSLTQARDELTASGVVHCEQTSKGVWKFSLPINRRNFNLKTLTSDEVRAYFNLYLSNIADEGDRLKADCPFHHDCKKLCFSVNLSPVEEEDHQIGRWVSFCKDRDPVHGGILDFEQQRTNANQKAAHTAVMTFFAKLRKDRRESFAGVGPNPMHRARPAYKPRKEETEKI